MSSTRTDQPWNAGGESKAVGHSHRRFPVETNPHLMCLDVQELSNIHEVYAKMKTAVAASSEQAVSSIDLIRKNLVPDLHGTVMDFYKGQQKKVGHAWEDVWMFVFARLSRVCCWFDEMSCLVRMALMTAVKTTAAVRERRHSRRSVQLHAAPAA